MRTFIFQLMHCAEEGNRITISLLLHFGADVHQRRQSEAGETAMFYAIRRNR
jgi:ankyrin repeat protein